MKDKLLFILKEIILFLIGGSIYIGIEIAYRGRSHYSMFIVGGLCFIFIGLINYFFTWEMPLISQMFISTFIILSLELVSGLIVNVGLGLDVWDYSDQPYNLWGQICLLFGVIWFFFSVVPIVLDDYLRYKLFGEEKPRYKIFM